MEKARFVKFVMLHSRVQKQLQKIKLLNAVEVGIKGVHMLWIYDLYRYPEGRTASELAQDNRIDRSLISREISSLQSAGYIYFESGSTHNYNCKIRLTERGRALAEQIGEVGYWVQSRVNDDIDEQELQIFYRTLEKLCDNLEAVAEEHTITLTPHRTTDLVSKEISE